MSSHGYFEGAATHLAGLKPHCICAVKECRTELEKVHQLQTNLDLTLAELRILLNRARQRAGMINKKKPTMEPKVMDRVKSATMGALKLMCQENRLGELRMLQDDEQYCRWAVREVQESSGPDSGLVRFVRWSETVLNGEMETDTEWTPVNLPTDHTSTPTKIKAVVSMGSPASPGANPASGSSSQETANVEIAQLCLENAKLAEKIRNLEQLMGEMLAEKKTKA